MSDCKLVGLPAINEKQKAAMISFCTRNAGEIKYVPEFNSDGQCTVMAYQESRLRADARKVAE